MKIYIVSIPLMPFASIFFIYWYTTPTIRSEYRESCTFRQRKIFFGESFTLKYVGILLALCMRVQSSVM